MGPPSRLSRQGRKRMGGDWSNKAASARPGAGDSAKEGCASASASAFSEFGSFVLSSVRPSTLWNEKGKASQTQRRRRNASATDGRKRRRRRRRRRPGKGNSSSWELRREPEQILKLSLCRQLRRGEYDVLVGSAYGLAIMP